jgi:hypothetical protein
MFAFERNRPLVGHAVYVFALPSAAKTKNQIKKHSAP